jgi:molybdate transport system substrate-binding protein
MYKQSSRKRYFQGIVEKKFFVRSNILLYICIALVSLLPFRVTAASQNEITVSAAASLTNVFEEVAKNFETRKKGVKVHINFASSGNLMRQIIAGAPVDVFASAAAREMDELDKRQLLIDGTRHNFAENGIVLIRPASFKTGLTSFTDLKKNVIKKIAMGNPATVPAGMYAEQTLRNQKIWDSIKDKMIYCEHVRQVLDYVARGEVDAGIVFSTDTAVRAKEVTVVVMAPEGIYNKALYPIAVVRDTKNEALSKMFVDFVLSAEGKKLLEKYGLKSMK